MPRMEMPSERSKERDMVNDPQAWVGGIEEKAAEKMMAAARRAAYEKSVSVPEDEVADIDREKAEARAEALAEIQALEEEVQALTTQRKEAATFVKAGDVILANPEPNANMSDFREKYNAAREILKNAGPLIAEKTESLQRLQAQYRTRFPETSGSLH